MRWFLPIAVAAFLAGGPALAQEAGVPSREATPEEAPPPGSPQPQPPETPPAAVPPSAPVAAPQQQQPAAQPQQEKPRYTGLSKGTRTLAHPPPPPIDCLYQQLVGTVVGMDDTTLWLKHGTTAIPLRLTPATSLDGGLAQPSPPTAVFNQGDEIRACYVARPLPGEPVLNVALAVDGPRSHEP